MSNLSNRRARQVQKQILAAEEQTARHLGSRIKPGEPGASRLNGGAVKTDTQRSAWELHLKDLSAASDLHRDRFTHFSP